MKDKIIDGLHRQFMSSCTMLRQAVENVPDDRWHSGGEGWFFSLTAYHIVETIEFYLRDNPDGMIWGGRAGYDWDKSDDIQKDILPRITKEIVTSYLDEVEKMLADVFSTQDTKSLSSKDGFAWFSSIFEKLLYLLRHNNHHIGELSKTLRDWQCKRVEWR